MFTLLRLLARIIITGLEINRPVNFFVAVFGPGAQITQLFASMTNAFLVYTLVLALTSPMISIKDKVALKNEPFDGFLLADL